MRETEQKVSSGSTASETCAKMALPWPASIMAEGWVPRSTQVETVAENQAVAAGFDCTQIDMTVDDARIPVSRWPIMLTRHR